MTRWGSFDKLNVFVKRTPSGHQRHSFPTQDLKQKIAQPYSTASEVLILLRLLANSRPLATQDCGGPLHCGALLGLVEGRDAIGDRLDDGPTTLFKGNRCR